MKPILLDSNLNIFKCNIFLFKNNSYSIYKNYVPVWKYNVILPSKLQSWMRFKYIIE